MIMKILIIITYLHNRNQCCRSSGEASFRGQMSSLGQPCEHTSASSWSTSAAGRGARLRMGTKPDMTKAGKGKPSRGSRISWV